MESALVDNDKVAEAAVVGAEDDTTGQAIVAFVTLRGTTEASDEVGEEASTWPPRSATSAGPS